MLPLHDEPRCLQGEDVYNADEAPVRSHLEDCYANRQKTCGETNNFANILTTKLINTYLNVHMLK